MASIMQLDANQQGAFTDPVPISSVNAVGLFVSSNTGTHDNHLITIEVSPNGNNWFPVGRAIIGVGSTTFPVVGRYARALVERPEGSASLVDVMLVADSDDPFINAIPFGDAFTWSTRHSSGNDDHMMYIRNNNPDKCLYFISVNVGAKTDCVFTFNLVDGLGSGTAANEFNMDGSGAPSLAVTYADNVQDVGNVTPISYRLVSSYGGSAFSIQRGMCLPFGGAATIQISKASTETVATVAGYFA